ncbi:MAG: VWA domain-containing protein [Candidatus Tectomicrobia bacterium]|nr:VWA domain-containing protein [Candidatus Tectomicrobia bacterium]
MERRLVEFVAALRAAGVRVSVAESEDCFRAVEAVGVQDRTVFRDILAASLVKERRDLPTFNDLFPLYFGHGQPPMLRPQDALSEDEEELLRQALEELAGRLNELLRRLLDARALSQEELEAMQRQGGPPPRRSPRSRDWRARQLLRALGLKELEELLNELFEKLAALGMSEEGMERLRALLGHNLEALEEQLRHFAGQAAARQHVEEQERRPGPDLLDRPFSHLSEAEAHALRQEVRRLAARLRSRAALRQRRGRRGGLDAKATVRANQRYAGVPLDLRFKRRRLKPKLVLICDISTSVRFCAEFLLRLIYELQDQVAKARSFAFIDHLEEISDDFNEHHPQEAIVSVLRRLPAGHYNTDLGQSLAQFCHTKLDAVDRRTTVIILGDGRNNYHDPRLDCFELMKRRARRLVWMNPEAPHLWGTGDSDIQQYIPHCYSVHKVSTLAELAAAVDRLFGA